MNLWHSLRCIATRITAITKICTEMLRNDGHWVLANFVTRSGLARLSPSHHGILSCPRLIHSYAQLPLLCGIEQYHVVEPIAISGNDLVVLRISDRKVADTKLCPIEYDFYRLTEPIPGTVLLLPGCTRKLADALLKGLSHFFYDENSLLDEHLWSRSGDEFRIFKSANNCGHVFYRKLKRDEIDGIPLVLVINKLLAPCG